MVVVVIVTYNPREWLDRCLSSVIDYPTIVVDNNSNDGSVENIKINYPDVQLIETGENLGFAKANNIGIKKALEAGGEYVFLLNQDAWVNSDTIGELIKVSKQDSSYGIVSPLHLNGAGNMFDHGFFNYITRSTLPARFMVSNMVFGKPLAPVYEFDFINAAFWLIPKSVIESVGYFRSDLFRHYGEDVNYCHRVLYKGYKIGVVPQVVGYHDRESRFNRKKANDFDSFNQDLALKLQLANPFNDFNEIFDSKVSMHRKNALKALIKLRFQRCLNSIQEIKSLYSIRRVINNNVISE